MTTDTPLPGVLTTVSLVTPVGVDYVRIDKHWFKVNDDGCASWMQHDYGVWAGRRPATAQEARDHAMKRVEIECGAMRGEFSMRSRITGT
jgi:hypothetical protein